MEESDIMAYIKDDVVAVVSLEPSISDSEFLLPLGHC